MSVQTTLARVAEPGAGLRTAADRRRHKRYELSLVGRYMRADRHEYACRLIDISVGGASISSPAQPEIGESVIVYIDELGGLEGTATRIFDGGFAIDLRATQHKREKLAAKITWLINRQEFGSADAREHERILPQQNTNTLKISDEIAITVQLLDVSLSGANIATEARPPIGMHVMLGKMRAQVMRHHDRGIGVRFLDIQEKDGFSKAFS